MQAPFSSPRVRDLLQIMCSLHPSFGADSRSILDVSQLIHMTAYRADGLVPTATTGAWLYQPATRRRLSVAALAILMGFDMKSVAALSSMRPTTHARRMLGNTMHVAVVGSICSIAAALAERLGV